MSTQTIDGKRYAQMLLGGASLLASHASEINELNVFPVADGDTGTNMLKTIKGGLTEIISADDRGIGELTELFAKGVLLSARGNSGVILSQIFAGIGEGLTGYHSVTALQLANAYKLGIKKSYAAVQNPMEGTILTVFRESTDRVAEKITEETSIEEFFRLHIEEARRSLAATKELLPVLKEADVIDSGAAGYLYIAEGMYQVLSGVSLPDMDVSVPEGNATLDIDSFTRDSILEYGYCTEFLLRLTTAKCDPDSFLIEPMIEKLTQMGGESIVAYKQGDIVKVHVHTFHPGDVLAYVQSFGEFLTVKIENMSLGHSENIPTKKAEKKKFSVVAVASGDGICALFKDMGADVIISGGQTANPSAGEFVEAFDECNSEHIIVLPNNKNVFLAAKQAAEIYKNATIHIVETKSLMQGYSALSVITPGITDMDSLVQSATRAASGVIDGEITKAVRDVKLGDKCVTEGDYIAISGGEITSVADSAEEAVLGMLRAVDTDLAEIITLFVGSNVTSESRAALTEKLKQDYPDFEIVVYEGGQAVYDYLVAVE